MPGGCDEYLESLRWMATSIRNWRVSRAEFEAAIMDHFNITPSYASEIVKFLLKAEFIQVHSGSCTLADITQSWLSSGDDASLIAQLHRKVQFIGEMLNLLANPMMVSDLRRKACEQYRVGWRKDQQITTRRGWMQSAGLMGCAPDKRLFRTDAGTAFLDLVAVEPPLDRHVDGHSILPEDRPRSNRLPRREESSAARHVRGDSDRVLQEPDAFSAAKQPDAERPSRQVSRVIDLADRIVVASTDTRNPAEFEKVVCEAFSFLGFDAKHLGGSGDTDVLVDARLGRGASYSVTIDAKTTSAPALQDQQVDWVTLSEHRSKHGADYSMLVGPNPSTRRLLERARNQGVAVLSAEVLAGLCRSHAARPLGLADYKSMFQNGGTANLADIEQQSDQAGKLTALAGRLLDAIGEDAERFGPVIARDLHRRLARDEGNIVATEAEIQALLHTLASPLVGAIQGDSDSGYVLACSPTVTAERLRILGKALSDG